MAAAVALLQQAGASAEGPVPLIPSEPTSRGAGADVVQEWDRKQDEEYTSSDSEQPETGGNASNGIRDAKDKVEPLLTVDLDSCQFDERPEVLCSSGQVLWVCRDP